MKYKFGVMSSRYELECDDDIIAKVAMALYCHTSAPIVIFEPCDKQGAFKPTDILQSNKEYSKNNREKLIKCYQSITQSD